MALTFADELVLMETVWFVGVVQPLIVLKLTV